MRKLIFLLAILAGIQLTAWSQKTVLIRNTTIVDVEKGTIARNANVLIKDSVIEQITFNKTLPAADTTVDGTNRFLIPGLWDMHTHVWSDEFFFPLMIANGVTGMRGMFEDMNNVKTWRNKIASGKLAGPELKVAGPIVDGPQPVWPGSVAVKTPEQGRMAVDSLKNVLHTDFIKVYSLLSRDAYFAIADEAKKLRIPFAGHVPNLVNILEAAKAGQKSQEHLYGFIEASSDSAAYYMELVQGTRKDTTLRDRIQRRNFLLRTYNPKILSTLLQQMKQYDTWICPTLTVNYGIAYMNDTSLMNDPRMQYMVSYIRTMWDPTKDFRFKSLPPAAFDIYRKEFDLKLQMVKAIHDAGIPLLAGTDFPNPYCYPGFSLHDELQWMVKAGLTPAQALRTATLNPALYFKIQDKIGTVAKSKMANLLLLDGDPLKDISNTKKIAAVILRGKVYRQPDLAAMLDKVKQMINN